MSLCVQALDNPLLFLYVEGGGRTTLVIYIDIMTACAFVRMCVCEDACTSVFSCVFVYPHHFHLYNFILIIHIQNSKGCIIKIDIRFPIFVRNEWEKMEMS
jgi:hypothetical protein